MLESEILSAEGKITKIKSDNNKGWDNIMREYLNKTNNQTNHEKLEWRIKLTRIKAMILDVGIEL